MAARHRPERATPKPRRSKTVWPVVFGVLLLVTLLLVLAFSLGWLDGGADLEST